MFTFCRAALLALVIIAGSPCPARAQDQAQAQEQTPAEAPLMVQAFTDTFNTFIVFAPNATDLRFTRQHEEFLKHRDAAVERDIMLIIAESETDRISLRSNKALSKLTADNMPTVDGLSALFNPDKLEFLAVLLNRDGTVKRTWDVPVPVVELLSTIDGKPIESYPEDLQENLTFIAMPGKDDISMAVARMKLAKAGESADGGGCPAPMSAYNPDGPEQSTP